MSNTTSQGQPDVAAAKDNGRESEKFKRQTLPVFSLAEIIKFGAKVYTELGYNEYHSKDLIAQIHNVTYDGIKQKFSTAQEYGIFELKHGQGYKLTPQFLKIYKPENDEEKKEGIIESLRRPELYARLIDESNGHPLPSESGLSARLIRNFGIRDYAATRAAQVFLFNLRENGFIDANGCLNIPSERNEPPPLPSNAGEAEREKQKTDTNPPTPPASPAAGYIEIPIPLNGGKRAYIKIPEDYKTEDCERIAKFVEALK